MMIAEVAYSKIYNKKIIHAKKKNMRTKTNTREIYYNKRKGETKLKVKCAKYDADQGEAHAFYSFNEKQKSES